MSEDRQTVLVTGANGFIGKALAGKLASRKDLDIIAASRNVVALGANVRTWKIGDLASMPDLVTNLREVDVVVHTAGRAHKLKETSTDPLAAFRAINVDAALHFAEQAKCAGVKRFVFLSSIGVNGNGTTGKAFSESDTPNPGSPYAQSKLEAERALRALCEDGKMELVIIRPPLVYGVNAPGNFGLLIRVVRLGLPMPFSAVQNKRSMIALDNLVSFIELTIRHPGAAFQTFVVADDYDLSTPELIRLLAKGMGRSIMLFPFPLKLMEWGASVLGRRNMFEQLTGSLQIDCTKASQTLGWRPMVNTRDALTDLVTEMFRED